MKKQKKNITSERRKKKVYYEVITYDPHVCISKSVVIIIKMYVSHRFGASQVKIHWNIY